MTYNHYNKNLKEFARELRSQRATKAEQYLWKSTLSKRKTGYRFLRQRPIQNYIVDFFCPELNLIIEIDGSSHISKGNYDSQRESSLENLGYIIIRFSEGEILNNLNGVVLSLEHVIHCLNESNREINTL